MSKTMDNLQKWIKSFKSGRIWFNSLRTKATIENYLPRLKEYCDYTGKNPDELLALKLSPVEAQLKIMKLLQDGKKIEEIKINEREAEELLETTLAEIPKTHSMKVAIKVAVLSFYRKNHKPLLEGTADRWKQQDPKERTPDMQDLEILSENAKLQRDKAFIWFCTTAIRDGTITQLKWKDLQPTENKEIPYLIIIEGKRLKGKGEGRYKGLKQVTFVNWFIAEKLERYRKEASRKHIELTEDSPLFISYRSNGNGNTKLGKALTVQQLRKIFYDASLDAWGDLEKKRFSPHDVRDFVQTSLERAGMSSNWVKKVMGHKLKGEENPYSKPKVEQLMEAYRKALVYLIPERRQRISKRPVYQPVIEQIYQQFQGMAKMYEANIEALERIKEATTDPNLKQLYETQITIMKDALKQAKKMPKPDYSRIDKPLTDEEQRQVEKLLKKQKK